LGQPSETKPTLGRDVAAASGSASMSAGIVTVF
jgi:hypothetical protein